MMSADSLWGFSTSGKYLTTPGGQCPFTSAEFTAYTALSAVIDKQRWPLLQRSLLKEDELHALLAMPVMARADPSKDALTFIQTMILLKSVAHLQRLHKERPGQPIPIDDFFFATLHDAGTDGTKQVAEFHLKRVLPPTAHLLRDAYTCYISGYEVRAQTLENAHVVYKLCTTTTTSGPRTALAGSPVDGEPVVYTSEVTRRFKDFEFLLRILQDTAAGCVVPPLPSKAFVFNRCVAF